MVKSKRKKLGEGNQKSLLSLLIKIAGLLLTILTIIVTIKLMHGSFRHPHLEVELRGEYTGYKIRVLNKGTSVANEIYVDVLAWREGAPGPDVDIQQKIRDLIPNSDFTFGIDFYEQAVKHGYQSGQRFEISGYIVASCNNCVEPKAWAFRISEENWHYSVQGSLPMVEFNYPEDKPYVGATVNYPKEFSKWGWSPKKK